MTAVSEQVLDNALGAMETYIDRLYKTINWHGKTCGLLMSNPGNPIWTKTNEGQKGVWVGGTRDGYKGVFLYDGESWTEKDSGMSTAAKEGVHAIAVCPHDCRIVLASTDDGVWRTTDKGESWSQVLVADPGWRGIAWDVKNPGKAIMAGPDNGGPSMCAHIGQEMYHPAAAAARSTDYGANWTSFVLTVPDGGAFNLPAHQACPPSLVAYDDGKAVIVHSGGLNTGNNYCWSSLDAGVNWLHHRFDPERFNGSIGTRVADDPSRANAFFALLQYISRGGGWLDQGLGLDGGGSFELVQNGPPTPGYAGTGHQLLRDTRRARWWYANDLVYYSDSDGGQWSTVQPGAHFDADSIAYDHVNDALYVAGVAASGYAATYGGTYVSFDGGTSWIKLSDYHEGLAICAANTFWAASVSKLNSYHALGQYSSDTGEAHSFVSGQPNAPAWIDAGETTDDSDAYDLGIESGSDGDYKDPAAYSVRLYDTDDSSVDYSIGGIADQNTADPGKVDVYLGPEKLIDDLAAQSNNWVSGTVHKGSDGNQDYPTSMNYPPRHGFHLGLMHYTLRGDATKAAAFQNSIDESSLDHDLYDVILGLVGSLDTYFMFEPTIAFRDAYVTDQGDQCTAFPVGIADDGHYVYPHASKVGFHLSQGPLTLAYGPLFYSLLARFSAYGRAAFALKMLHEGPISVVRPDPRVGWVQVDPRYVTAFDVGLQLLEEYVNNAIPIDEETRVPIGLPAASADVLNGMLSTSFPQTGSAYQTAMFSILMTFLGKAMHYQPFSDVADSVANLLCRTLFGASPNFDDRAFIRLPDSGGQKQFMEIIRPQHTGGAFPIWDSLEDTPGYPVAAQKAFFDKAIDSAAFADVRLPD